ncbi:MAG: UDP-3-O-acyl-N-acetylglucosamine deacetylase [Lentisphaeria bacterium]|nr:UDP-3-O-acyl-N-acetylglucosamine deacetylase [Lentisphaeria bacterium]
MPNAYGRLLEGDPDVMRSAWETFAALPVDQDILAAERAPDLTGNQTTIASDVEVSGKGTFAAKNTTAIHFKPCEQEGWWFNRSDLGDELPVKVSINNVWTTGAIVSNIVLRSGGPSNYIRLVEHIISLKTGLGIDNVMMDITSGDPPIFDQGSLDIVEALEKAGRRTLDTPRQFVTVKEKVCLVGARGEFVMLEPPEDGRKTLTVDCGISFKTAIGDQRVRFPVTREWLRHACVARTNTPYSKVLYCQTIGKLFADIRNLGYTRDNVLIAGKNDYKNEPRLVSGGKSLEAVWHRATLDLLAAVALIDQGIFVGHVTSFKAGHRLDVALLKQVCLQDCLVTI